MIIFPVRHHSPAAALQVERLIRERRPRAVLVEGPADASELIPLLLDPESAPPLALYAYRTGEEVRASFYPFCAYSPEYAALKAGQAVGATLQFCDLPATFALAPLVDGGHVTQTEPPAAALNGLASYPPSTDTDPPPASGLYPADFAAALTEAAGFDDDESFWEAAIEQDTGSGPAVRFIEVLTGYGTIIRGLSADDGGHDQRRERYMAGVARAVIAAGVPEEDVLLVCGAAHAAAIAGAFRAGAPPPDLGETPPAALALIPYSYPRLSEQSGYGAGNRAPWFYQQVWQMGGDYHQASRRALVLVARHLRERGHAASPAHCIDAYGLARTLATMRGKRAPGVDEVREAAVACFGQGQVAIVEDALRQVLIGDAVGRVTARVGRTPLQSEFYATANRLRLPVVDQPRQILAHMTVPAEAEQSIFLHRLGVAGVPYAEELTSGLGGGGRAAGGPLQQLSRVLEKWQLQWSPSTDAMLIERSAWGSTLAEVSGRLLGERVTAAPRVDTAVEALLAMALCDLVEPFDGALARCETLAADSSSFVAPARAAYYLDGLLAYGAARRLPVERLSDLAGRLFARAVVQLPAAAVCGDDAVAAISDILVTFYELIQRNRPLTGAPDRFWDAVEQVVARPESHPTLRGAALTLLELGGRLAAGELAARLRFHLSATAEASANANLVAGLFSLQRATLVRNRGLIAAVTEFFTSLAIEQLTPLLPVLRRSLGNLAVAERAYLAETLDAVLGVAAGDSGRTLRVTAVDRLLLGEIDGAVTGVLTEWRDRYGIE